MSRSLCCILAVLVLCLGSQQCSLALKLDPEVAVGELYKCFNEVYNSSGFTFDDYVSGRASQSVRLHRAWWSQQESDLALGVYSMTDLTRLDRLAAQCRSYPGGVMAAAVHITVYEPPANPTGDASGSDDSIRQAQGEPGSSASATPGLGPENAAKVAAAEAQLEDFFNQMESVPPINMSEQSHNSSNSTMYVERPGACVLRLMLLYEVVSDEAALALFPINLVRNVGMLALDTPLALSVDVDFSLNRGLVDEVLLNETRITDLVQRAEADKAVWVVPAWETGRHVAKPAEIQNVMKAVEAMQMKNKGRMLDMWLFEQSIVPFHTYKFKWGHHATNHYQWCTTGSEYAVKYEGGYEPWFISSRIQTPVWDVKYRGRGYNKLVLMSFLNQQHYKYYVMPDACMIHRPHNSTETEGLLYKEQVKDFKGNHDPEGYMDMDVRVGNTTMKARDAFAGRNYAFYLDDFNNMWLKKYKVVSDPASENCRAKLPWWQV